MNGYSTLLHSIAPGKYIVIKVEYGLQLRFNIYLNKCSGSCFFVGVCLSNYNLNSFLIRQASNSKGYQ